LILDPEGTDMKRVVPLLMTLGAAGWVGCQAENGPGSSLFFTPAPEQPIRSSIDFMGLTGDQTSPLDLTHFELAEGGRFTTLAYSARSAGDSLRMGISLCYVGSLPDRIDLATYSAPTPWGDELNPEVWILEEPGDGAAVAAQRNATAGVLEFEVLDTEAEVSLRDIVFPATEGQPALAADGTVSAELSRSCQYLDAEAYAEEHAPSAGVVCGGDRDLPDVPPYVEYEEGASVPFCEQTLSDGP
jgi:hypothetical protein